MCMAAAMTFGLAYELWAKIALESGYGAEEPREAPKAAPKAQPAAAKAEAPAEASEASFREAALAKGVDTRAIDAIVAKLGGKWEAGLKTLAAKSAEELNAKYAPADDAGEQW